MVRAFGIMVVTVVVSLSAVSEGWAAARLGGHIEGGTGSHHKGGHEVGGIGGSGHGAGAGAHRFGGSSSLGSEGNGTSDVGSKDSEALRTRLVPATPMYRLGPWHRPAGSVTRPALAPMSDHDLEMSIRGSN